MIEIQKPGREGEGLRHRCQRGHRGARELGDQALRLQGAGGVPADRPKSMELPCHPESYKHPGSADKGRLGSAKGHHLTVRLEHPAKKNPKFFNGRLILETNHPEEESIGLPYFIKLDTGK